MDYKGRRLVTGFMASDTSFVENNTAMHIFNFLLQRFIRLLESWAVKGSAVVCLAENGSCLFDPQYGFETTMFVFAIKQINSHVLVA